MLYPDFFSQIEALFARVRERTSWIRAQPATNTSGEERLSPSKLRRLAERYRVLVENAPVGIHEIDRLRTLTVVNRAGLRMLGRGKSIFGVPVLDVVSLNDRPRISRLLDLALAGEFCEFEFTTPGERTFLSCFMPLKDKDGAVYKILGMSQDITHRKKAEERLKQVQKMEALGKLAGSIAHDFNNTLSVIIGYANWLQLEPSPEKVQEYATEVLRAAQQASSLTRQLLAFSRRQVVRPQTVDLNTVIEGVSKMLRRLIREDIELCIRLASDLPSITADAAQIEQIIVNLAVNARDAMSAGGRLTISTSKADLDNAHARLLGLGAGPHAVLTVSDNGHGMNAETQVHLFEPFFTTKEAGKGTGLGLATVHAVVLQSGGNISVDSQVGVGTEFTIHFPASTTSAAIMKSLPVMRPTVPAAETILLVEDEHGLRKLMKELLRTEGYTVIESADGPSAIETSKNYDGTIHLLLTDMIMPRMHGQELAMQLRQQRPELKVLYFTGHIDPETLDGVNVIEKPIIPEALLREIREVLNDPDEFIRVAAG
jgi:two-component system, cell cycle sensor histidine kinase and response regulator CckA